jgi:hypothetical protein
VAARPRPLPAHLPSALFTVRDALDAGVNEGRLRRGDLRRPTYGVRVPKAAPDTVVGRARAFALALPHDIAFSHLTAARLFDLPTPRPWHPTEPLHVMRRSGRPPVERRGTVPHRGLELRSTLVVDGLLLVDPVDTWCDLGPLLELDDLVAVGDALLTQRLGLRPKDLARAVADRRGRGIRRLREALALVRVGSASAWESKARVAFVSWGLPEPELNADVFTDDGRWLARPDFVWRTRRVVGEYDGDQHRTDRRAWQYERERRARLEDDGWTYVEMTALSLSSPTQRAHLRARFTRLLT